ncbi:TPR repeat:TPR repeat [Desulfovibrio sp. DV]|nr:TPR repeat:TPR repeat [Desulfovibrio sp. DV]
MAELQWYLEQFLDYPFHPETKHAERVLASLKSWGEAAFNALFDARDSGGIFDEATKDGYHHLQLRVISDDPKVQSWPWEALRDPKADFLAHDCQVERRMDSVKDPVKLHPDLPTDQVNVLLVTARPYKQDVAYQSVSGPLVELIESKSLPARVHVLRPPTFARLTEHLEERPGFYHIVHFDGHGTLDGKGPPNQLTFKAEGKLVFEDEHGEPDVMPVDQLGPLLREHNIPCVVLNACQSGMHDAAGGDPFASVASALLKAGIRSVVAMAYTLYVSGARTFLPDFYRRLFTRGSVAEGVRAGRKAMLKSKGRVCAAPKPHPLEDWLVPVLYQQEPLDFTFAAAARKDGQSETPSLPEEACDLGSSGFVGREGAILALERAMRGRAAGILVHGMGGVGKTTLAKGFLQWLSRTEGLGMGALWLSFKDIRSAEYVLNAMGGPLFGEPFLRCDIASKVENLTKVLREHPFLFVWDNFETVAGIPGTTIAPLLSEADRQVLKDLLRRLGGGKTKVLITSRSPEAWLGREQHRVIELGGLRGDERWEYCQRIIDNLGLRIDRKDMTFKELMDHLRGHPLSMRAILPSLEKHSAAAVLAALRENIEALGPQVEEAQQAVHATLRYAMEAVPMELRPLLYPLSLHEAYADANHLAAMAKLAELDLKQDDINQFFGILGILGVAREVRQNIHELHPALTGYLRSNSKAEPPKEEARLSWRSAFARVMAGLANAIRHSPLQAQRRVFHVHQTNIHQGLEFAKEYGLVEEERAILQCLAGYALDTLAFEEARRRYQELAERSRAQGFKKYEAIAFHQLGRVAQGKDDLIGAREWYRKALEITECLGDEINAATTYHELGFVALQEGDLTGALVWYQKSLEVWERHNHEALVAKTYHQLGRVAQEGGDLPSARKWCMKAKEIFERCGDEAAVPVTYHQLGRVAQQEGDLTGAREWCLKALGIMERHEDEAGAAGTYHQLGIVAQQEGDLTGAREWYLKSLEIKERRGDEAGAARVYHELGRVAQGEGDLTGAREWYLKALEIKERRGIEAGLALTCAQFGTLEQAAGDSPAARSWFEKALTIFEKRRDEANIAKAKKVLVSLA